jgi:hypothetical protein
MFMEGMTIPTAKSRNNRRQAGSFSKAEKQDVNLGVFGRLRKNLLSGAQAPFYRQKTGLFT